VRINPHGARRGVDSSLQEKGAVHLEWIAPSYFRPSRDAFLSGRIHFLMPIAIKEKTLTPALAFIANQFTVLSNDITFTVGKAVEKGIKGWKEPN